VADPPFGGWRRGRVLAAEGASGVDRGRRGLAEDGADLGPGGAGPRAESPRRFRRDDRGWPI